MSDDSSNDRPAESMTIFPMGTHFFAPDDIHQVVIQFPDENSAVLFFEWCRSLVNGEEVDNVSPGDDE